MCPRMHQIAPFFFQKDFGGHAPGPPSMASRLLRTQEITSSFKYGEKDFYFVTC